MLKNQIDALTEQQAEESRKKFSSNGLTHRAELLLEGALGN